MSEAMIESKYINTSKKLREILTDIGFQHTKLLGAWQLSETLYPNNTIQLYRFTINFWIEENGRKIYSNNDYRKLLISDFIEILMKIINKYNT